MQVLHPICAGMDVHKKDVKVCLMTRDSQGQRQEARTVLEDVRGGQGCKISI